MLVLGAERLEGYLTDPADQAGPAPSAWGEVVRSALIIFIGIIILLR